MKTTVSSSTAIPKPGTQQQQARIGTEVLLSIEWNRVNDEITLGPHTATVTLAAAAACENPRLWLRLTGAALVHIPVQPTPLAEASATLAAAASFFMPIAGRYQVEAQWYGCNTAASDSFATKTLDEPMFVTASKHDGVEPKMVKSTTAFDVFPTGFWVSSSSTAHFSQKQQDEIKSDYIWLDVNKRERPPSSLQTLYAFSKPNQAIWGNRPW